MKSTRNLTVCVLVALAAPGFAAELSIEAIAVNGLPLPNSQALIDVNAGDTITAAFFVEAWGPQRLRAYQVQIDAGGTTSGTTGELGVMSAQIDTTAPDYVFAFANPGSPPPPEPGEVLTAVDPSQSNIRWTSVLSDPADSATDPGVPGYLGEFTLVVSGDASGTFTQSIIAEGTFLRDDGAPPADIVVTTAGDLQITVTGGCACDLAADCVDTDANNVIDDICLWGQCVAGPCGTCNIIAKSVPADISGAFGACLPDGFCNVHDRNQALSCFSGASSCERLNIDAGGAFGACGPDGFCNIHDANAALACFAGTSTCSCGAAPEGPGPLTVDHVDVRLVAPRTSRGGDRVHVTVLTDSPIRALQSYQLHLAVSGGRRGALALEEILVEPRKTGAVQHGPGRFEAVNAAIGQVLVGLDASSVAVPADSYLATFVYRASPDAEGSFVIDVRHDEALNDQTFFVAPRAHRVAVNYVTAARVSVEPRRGRADR